LIDQTKKIIEHLTYTKESISFAESCTGGRIATAFTSISGASAILGGSCITYSNEIKHLWLGVKEETLVEYGAVSKECVEEMLLGIKKMARSDYAIAVSGIAGPSGGTDEKPVGLVYIGLSTPQSLYVEKYYFDGSREDVQNRATEVAIEMLFIELKL